MTLETGPGPRQPVLPVTRQGWPRVDERAAGLPETVPDARAFPSEAHHCGHLAQPSARMARATCTQMGTLSTEGVAGVLLIICQVTRSFL